jgi:hypothetical protein
MYKSSLTPLWSTLAGRIMTGEKSRFESETTPHVRDGADELLVSTISGEILQDEYRVFA